MELNTIISIQGFVIAVIFTVAVIIWRKTSNEKKDLLKCKQVVNIILLTAFVMVIKAFNVLPDPQNIRQILQYLLTAMIAISFFIEIRKAYKKRIPGEKNTELKSLTGLRKLIHKETETLEKETQKFEKQEKKLNDLRREISEEKAELESMNKNLKLKEKQLKGLDTELVTRKKDVEKKEKKYGKKESKLEEKRKEIKEAHQKIKEEKQDIGKKIKIMKLLEEEIKDQKEDLQIEKIKLERLKR